MIEYVLLGYDEFVHETDLALLFVIDGKGVWIPIKNLSPEHINVEGEGPGQIEVAEWFALQEGLI